MNDLKALLGFKGERGYSAYEIAVQNGYEGTEQDWLATLGTSSHFTQNSTIYEGDGETTEFALPSTYTSDSFVSVYVDGAKINDTDGYTISNNKVVFETAIDDGKQLEIILSSMSTNSLPIVTTINSQSTNDTAPGTKTVYDNILTPLNQNTTAIETVNTTLNTKIEANKTDADEKITALTTRMTTAETTLENKQNEVLYGTTAPSNNLGEDGDIYLQYTA